MYRLASGDVLSTLLLYVESQLQLQYLVVRPCPSCCCCTCWISHIIKSYKIGGRVRPYYNTRPTLHTLHLYYLLVTHLHSTLFINYYTPLPTPDHHTCIIYSASTTTHFVLSLPTHLHHAYLHLLQQIYCCLLLQIYRCMIYYHIQHTPYYLYKLTLIQHSSTIVDLPLYNLLSYTSHAFLPLLSVIYSPLLYHPLFIPIQDIPFYP